jgi:hypothetical protein
MYPQVPQPPPYGQYPVNIQQVVPDRVAVWPWYIAYAVVMALMYLFVCGAGVLLALLATKDEDRIQGVIMAIIGLPFAIPYAIAPMLGKTPGAWTYHLVLICIGLTSACCIPVSLPLLIFWLKPETKAYFGRV